MSIQLCVLWAMSGVLMGFIIGLAIKCYNVSDKGYFLDVYFISLKLIITGTCLFLFQPLLLFLLPSVCKNVIHYLVRFAEKNHDVVLPEYDRNSLEAFLFVSTPRSILFHAALGLSRAFFNGFSTFCQIVPGEVAKALKQSPTQPIIIRIKNNLINAYKLPRLYNQDTFARLCL